MKESTPFEVLVFVVLVITGVFVFFKIVTSSVPETLTNDEIILEARKCLNAGLNWDTNIDRTKVFCTHK